MKKLSSFDQVIANAEAREAAEENERAFLKAEIPSFAEIQFILDEAKKFDLAPQVCDGARQVIWDDARRAAYRAMRLESEE